MGIRDYEQVIQGARTLLDLAIENEIESPRRERNVALVAALYSSGARISELLSLTFGDLRNENGSTIAWLPITKNGKQHYIYLGDPLEFPADAALDEYRSVRNRMYRGSRVTDATALFPSGRGHKAISRIQAHRIIKALDPNFHCHLFRHARLSEIYKATKDIKAVQMVANHADIRSAARYTHISLSEMVASRREWSKQA